MKLKYGSSDGGGTFPEYPDITTDTVFEAEVLKVDLRESRWKNDDGSVKNEFNFRFKILDDGPQKGRYVWGTTPTWFNSHHKCKLANWVKALLDEPLLPEGMELDVQDLVGLKGRVMVDAKPKADGDGYWNNVKDVFPSRITPGSVKAPEAPGPGPAPKEYDPDDEPF